MDEKEQARALLDAFRAALPGGAPALSRTTRERSQPDDAFEVYILGLLVEAAVAEKFRVSWRTRSGEWHPRDLLFLRSPGQIYGGGDYTHAVLERGHRPALEAHIGVRFEGRSSVEHEADISLLPERVGSQCRAEGEPPNGKALKLLIEAKLYASGPLALGHARGALGLAAEVGPSTIVWLASTQDSSPGRRLLTFHAHRGMLWGDLPDDGTSNTWSDGLRDTLRQELRSLTA